MSGSYRKLRAVRPTFSRLFARGRVGADFFARRGAIVARERAPTGVVDGIEDLRNPGIDPRRVDPAVVAFFEDTASLDLHIRSHWRFPFSIAWRLGRWFMRWVGQFVLPLEEARIVTQTFALDPERDGRSDARAVIRTYADSGEVMQAVAYATWERAGARYMSAAFPMPGGQMMGILRLDAITEDARAVVLTSESKDGDDAGVWLVLGSTLAIPAPFGERLELWSAGMEGAPRTSAPEGLPDPTILGRHEQRFFGVRFVTHDYRFWPGSDRALRSKT
jgi:hypothetical protein